jgi:tetratricopeptide (TPR) repeat protein
LPAVTSEAPVDGWTARWLADAGLQLVGAAPNVAVPLLRWALASTPPKTSTNDDIFAVMNCRLAEALYRTGDTTGAAQVANAALAHAMRPELLVNLHLTLSQCLAFAGRPEDALASLTRGVKSSQIGPTERARLLAFSARAYRTLGQLDAARHAAEQALATASANGDDWATAWSLAVLSLVHGMRGEPVRALTLIDRSLAVTAGDFALADLQLMLLNNRANTLGGLDRNDEAIDVARRASQQAGEAGNVVRLRQAQCVLAELFFKVGRWDDSLAAPGDALATPQLVVESCNHGIAASIGFHRNDEAAWQHLSEANHHAVHVRGNTPAPLLLARCLAHEHANALPEALSVLTTALATEESEEKLELLADTARLAIGVGDQHTARAVVDRANAIAESLDLPHRKAVAAHCRGLLDRDPAALLAAADLYRAAGRPLPRAQALEAAGVAFAGRGDPANAASPFARAISGYRELGANWDLARIRKIDNDI